MERDVSGLQKLGGVDSYGGKSIDLVGVLLPFARHLLVETRFSRSEAFENQGQKSQ